MIDAQAVSAQLEKLGDLPRKTEGVQQAESLVWLRDAMQGLTLEHERDAAENVWVTLRGKEERSVVLGSYLDGEGESDALDSHVGMVAGLEAMKALAHRYGPQPPCTVQMVIWAMPRSAAGEQSGAGAFVPFPAQVAAYLELHVEPAGQAGGPALGVGAASAAGEQQVFHPRLLALADEAVREMTGTSGVLPATVSPIMAEIGRAEIPMAAMVVQSAAGAGVKELPGDKRLHLLQAAEAYGRWAEATLHLVAGDPVDLWAREHRVPRG